MWCGSCLGSKVHVQNMHNILYKEIYHYQGNACVTKVYHRIYEV